MKSASSTPTSDELRQQLVDDLRNKFGITIKTPPVDLKPDNQQSAGNIAGQSNIGEESRQPDEPDGFMKPTAKVLFKDIAYETIHHKGFKEALIKAGIAKNRVDELFQEHDAAPEKDKTNQPQSKP